MKIHELKELRAETVEKLNERVVELQKKVIKAKMPSLGENPKNVKIANAMKREIAQILTIIGEKGKETI